jgi:thymidylate kinase
MAFRGLAAAEPERCALIDSTQDKDKVAAEIWNIVEERLKP